ncbi:hypothetical protein [Fastidiosibacter lacustris]|uniref:hypothetical protein n=1 Tax=Fastidiosibacter lacustris TaxID=2056695 RepID=UPI000E34147B|nr:hypothetical protein [Fastidiosibacter lacustris]
MELNENNKNKSQLNEFNVLMQEAESMLRMGVPVSVVAKTLGISINKIRHLRNERSNNNE